MKFKQVGNVYCIRLFKGEEIVETLVNFLREQKISAGFISGIGALSDVTIGYFDSHKKTYNKRHIVEPLEILSLTGNVSLVDGEPFTHLHIMMGNKDYQVIGGHLFNGIISVTCEIYLTAIDGTIHREYDEDTGLKLLSL